MEFTALQIADILNGIVEGDGSVVVTHFSKIEDGKAGSLTFLANPKYERFIYSTGASAVLVNEDFKASEPVKAVVIRVKNAYASLAVLLDFVEKFKVKKSGVDPLACISASASVADGCFVGPFACIGEGAVIGENSRVHPHCVIGDGVVVGRDCVLYPGVKVYEGCIIGNRCILHAGAVVGADGFGFAPVGEEYKKIPQLGNVVLADDVEIGANTTIDRAVMGSTTVGRGVKIDNLVQIAHNVDIGSNTVMAAQVGISGSVKIGTGCRIGGQVGIAGHIKIGDNASLAAQTGIISDIAEGATVFGTPALNARSFLRSYSLFSKLPDIYRTINSLQKEVEALQKEIEGLRKL